MYLFKLYRIWIILSQKNNLTNIYSEMSKIRMKLGIPRI